MAIFPGAIATDSGLYIAVNNLSTLLTDNPLTIGATTVNVISTTGFPTVGFISIDAEIIFYTGKTATSFTGCVRGADGTTAASHALNAQVDHNVIAAHHNVLKDEIIAIETHLGVNGANIVHIAGSETITGQKTFTGVVSVTLGTGGIAGRLRIYPPTVSKGVTDFLADDNAGDTTTIIKTALQATNRTYTIPDAGISSFFVMADGTQTINGSKSFTSPVILSLGSAASTAINFGTAGTGLYGVSTNEVHIALAGTPVIDFLPTLLRTYQRIEIDNSSAGTATTPDYTWRTGNHGMFSDAANVIKWSTSSTTRMSLNAAGLFTVNSLSATLGANLAAGGNKITGLAAGTTAGDSLRFEQMKVVQVILANSETSFSTTSSTFQTTNLSATITPTSASNKILIWAFGNSSRTGTNAALFSIFRDTTNLATLHLGRWNTTVSQSQKGPVDMTAHDSPATTSARTYSVKIASEDNASAVSFGVDGGAQFMILMEVVA